MKALLIDDSSNNTKRYSSLLENNNSLEALFKVVLIPNFTKNYEIYKTQIWSNESLVICIDSYGKKVFCVSKIGCSLVSEIKSCVEMCNFEFMHEAYSSDEFELYSFELLGYNFSFIEEAAIYSRDKFRKELHLKK